MNFFIYVLKLLWGYDMRDKLLQIIKDNNKRMNPTEIMEHIKKDYSVSELREVVH